MKKNRGSHCFCITLRTCNAKDRVTFYNSSQSPWWPGGHCIPHSYKHLTVNYLVGGHLITMHTHCSDTFLKVFFKTQDKS